MKKTFLVYIIISNFSILFAQKNIPNWVKGAVFYQIYPQTYYDTNGDGIGDLQGIIQKLEYIKSLGIKAIWLSPFYESPYLDAGYDVSDYYKVGARYGTNDDARLLFKKAHDLGLKVIIDFIPGHTSIQHPWFKASCLKLPPYSNWYIWNSGTFDDAGKYNAQMIQGYCERNAKYMTNFFWHQPALNYGFGNPDPAQPWQLPTDHPDVLALKNEMKNILKFWLDMGADGFRVDMAGSLVKNDVNDKCSAYWRTIRQWLDKEYPEAFLVSEWSYPKSAIEGGFHADFFHWFAGYDDLFQKEKSRNRYSSGGYSYFDATGKGDITAFLSIYFEQFKHTKGKGYISLPVGNHDLIRINNGGRTTKDLAVIYAFQMTMPNIPFVYYGDEIGMKQLEIESGKEGAYGTRAGARTPMQWDATANAGFSTGKTEDLYFPIDNSATKPTVANQIQLKGSLWQITKELIQLRSTEKCLSPDADFIPLYAEKQAYPFIYLRSMEKERILVVLNPSKVTSTAWFALDNAPKKFLLLSGESAAIQVKPGGVRVIAKPTSYSIFKLLP